jgi:hypothetical protein
MAIYAINAARFSLAAAAARDERPPDEWPDGKAASLYVIYVTISDWTIRNAHSFLWHLKPLVAVG